MPTNDVLPLPEGGADGTELGSVSCLGLAHVGDAVYELLVRTRLCLGGTLTAESLHRRTVALVRAEAQSRAAGVIAPLLTDAEAAVFRRGRNAHSHAAPHGAKSGDYHAATGLEALFGWLYLTGREARARELFDRIMETEDAT